MSGTSGDKTISSSPIKTTTGQFHGINSCKGAGACGGKTHICAGQNSCKGKGWLNLSADDCEKRGGTFKS